MCSQLFHRSQRLCRHSKRGGPHHCLMMARVRKGKIWKRQDFGEDRQCDRSLCLFSKRNPSMSHGDHPKSLVLACYDCLAPFCVHAKKVFVTVVTVMTSWRCVRWLHAGMWNHRLAPFLLLFPFLPSTPPAGCLNPPHFPRTGQGARRQGWRLVVRTWDKMRSLFSCFWKGLFLCPWKKC